ncbi:hypothetical protein ISU02_02925 [Fusibacter sp. Q10-2]|uniref:Uncharacterized protein n=1 Tax=Fusibacter ferrireducens TaxID=2785058 RepID=A0ABR9ZNN1_9FIRM|nr:hypothetical protein [Fusibacter ferrireducens]
MSMVRVSEVYFEWMLYSMPSRSLYVNDIIPWQIDSKLAFDTLTIHSILNLLDDWYKFSISFIMISYAIQIVL